MEGEVFLTYWRFGSLVEEKFRDIKSALVEASTMRNEGYASVEAILDLDKNVIWEYYNLLREIDNYELHFNKKDA